MQDFVGDSVTELVDQLTDVTFPMAVVYPTKMPTARVNRAVG
jgi:hypothetical protein